MVEIKTEIKPALEQIEQLHKVTKDEIIDVIKKSITDAGIKFFGSDAKIITEIDIDKVEIKTYILKKVVQKVTNEKQEISIEEAKEIQPECKIGDEIKIVVDSDAFHRMAAQIAKKALLQKLRESYKKSVYEEYKSKIGEITDGTVYGIQGKTIVLDLGKAEGILPQREQVFKEKLKIGQHVKVFIKNVEKTKKGIKVIVSRFDKEFIKKLFETEIPEIKEHVVEIVNIVRAPGYRTKVVLKSNNPKVDPVGACVGVRGARIKPIINELHGERIDLIPYTEDIAKFVEYSLSPWKPQKVEIVDYEKKIAKVYLPQETYRDVVNKNDLNIKLAKELTGWNIEIALVPTNNVKNNETTKK